MPSSLNEELVEEQEAWEDRGRGGDVGERRGGKKGGGGDGEERGRGERRGGKKGGGGDGEGRGRRERRGGKKGGGGDGEGRGGKKGGGGDGEGRGRRERRGERKTEWEHYNFTSENSFLKTCSHGFSTRFQLTIPGIYILVNSGFWLDINMLLN